MIDGRARSDWGEMMADRRQRRGRQPSSSCDGRKEDVLQRRRRWMMVDVFMKWRWPWWFWWQRRRRETY
jgi:hypothetical protein